MSVQSPLVQPDSVTKPSPQQANQARMEEVGKEKATEKINKVQQVEKEQRKEPLEVSEESLTAAVEQINSYVSSASRDLLFSVDTDSGQTVVKVTDAETKKLIRQIPNEEALKIARQLDGQLQLNPNDESTPVGLLLIQLKA